MRWLTARLDTTWKRVLAAAALSGAIVFALQAFAESSYVQTQKIQIESAEGKHCQKWHYEKSGEETSVTCVRWAG